MTTFTGAIEGSRETSRPDASRGFSMPWLPLVPLLAIPILGTTPERLELVVLGVQAIFLLMALRNPVWVLGALALSEFTIRNYELILPATALIALGHALVDADLGPRARAMTITAGLFLSLAVASTLVADAALVRDLLRSYAPDIAIMLMIPLVIRDRHSFLQAGLVALIVATASASVALAQQVVEPRFLSVPHDTVVNVDLVDWGNRALGTDLNPILLTDHLMLLLFPAVGVLLMRGTSSRVSGLLVLGAVLAMGGALFFTETRSWVFSAAAALIAMALVLRGRIGGELILLMLLVAGGFLFWADQSGSRYALGPDSDGSAAARPVLWTAALNMAMDHPVLGVGYDQFKELSPSYANNVGKALLDRQGAGTILGRESPHNDFLGAWVSSGTGGLMLYVLMMWFTAQNFLHALGRFRDPLMKGIALGCFGALVAFAVNSSFHNLFTSALTFWILAGASLALTKLAEREPADGSADRRATKRRETDRMVTAQPKCHICGSNGERLLPWTAGDGEMRRCSECDFVFAWPVEDIDPVHVYSQAYEGHEARTQMDDYARRIGRRDIVAEHESLGLWSPAHHDTLAWIEANVPKGATVMEVGCGLGAFLRALRDRGYNAVGVDVARPVVEAAQREGFQAWCGTIDTVPEGWAEPAVIVSFFVIHHIQDPVAFLSTIRTRWGAPLIIAYNRAPTKETAESNNFPPRCWGWWSEKALGRALARAGFARVEISTKAKGLPQLFLPPRLHDFVSSILWRWPKLRVIVQPFFEKLLSAGFKLLRPIPRLQRSFEGGLLVIATPAETNGRAVTLEPVEEARV